MNHSLGSCFGTREVTSPAARQEELRGDSPAGELGAGCTFSRNVRGAVCGEAVTGWSSERDPRR